MPDQVDEMIRRLSSVDLAMEDEDEDDGADQIWMPPSDAQPVEEPVRKVAPTSKEAVGFSPRAKTMATVAKGGASFGVGAATNVTNITGGTAGFGALVGGATLSAGPIGLLIASAALTLATTGTKVVSAKKTHDHIKALEKIKLGAGDLTCNRVDNNHKFIVDKTLPYIIAKKKKKRLRKVGGAVPVIGAVETARAKVKAGLKWAKGTLGKNRLFHAEMLANHHTSARCQLTSAIIAELFGISNDDAVEASFVKTDQLAKVISIKMKSV